MQLPIQWLYVLCPVVRWPGLSIGLETRLKTEYSSAETTLVSDVWVDTTAPQKQREQNCVLALNARASVDQRKMHNLRSQVSISCAVQHVMYFLWNSTPNLLAIIPNIFSNVLPAMDNR